MTGNAGVTGSASNGSSTSKRKRTKSSGGQKKRRTSSKAGSSKSGGSASKRRSTKRSEGPSISAVGQWEHELIQVAKLDMEKVSSLCSAVFDSFNAANKALPWKIDWADISRRVTKANEQAWTGDRCKRVWRLLSCTHVFPCTSEQATKLNKLKVDEYLSAETPLAQFFPQGWDSRTVDTCLGDLDRQKRERDQAAKLKQQQIKLEKQRAAELSRQAKLNLSLGLGQTQSHAVKVPNAGKEQAQVLTLQQQQMLIMQAQAQAQAQAQQQQQQVQPVSAGGVSFPSTDAGFALWAAETKQQVIENALEKIRKEIPNLNNQDDAKRAEERASEVHQKLWLEWLATPEAQRQSYIVRSAVHPPGMLQALTDQHKAQLLQKQQQQQILLVQQTLQQQPFPSLGMPLPTPPMATLPTVVPNGDNDKPTDTTPMQGAPALKVEQDSAVALVQQKVVPAASSSSVEGEPQKILPAVKQEQPKSDATTADSEADSSKVVSSAAAVEETPGARAPASAVKEGTTSEATPTVLAADKEEEKATSTDTVVSRAAEASSSNGATPNTVDAAINSADMGEKEGENEVARKRGDSSREGEAKRETKEIVAALGEAGSTPAKTPVIQVSSRDNNQI